MEKRGASVMWEHPRRGASPLVDPNDYTSNWLRGGSGTYTTAGIAK